MKLLCDEGVERQIVKGLREEGHEVLYVAEMSSGISDNEVLELSSSSDAVLVTKDKDFGELIFRQGLGCLLRGGKGENQDPATGLVRIVDVHL